MTVATGNGGNTNGAPCQCDVCLTRAQSKPVRFWRWLTRLDLTKPPAPALRWLGILLVGLVYVAIGAPAAFGDWLWFAILGGFLIFPDVAGFGVAGVRLDLKQAQDDLTALKLRLDVRQTQIGQLHLHGDEAEELARVLGRSVPAAAGEQAAQNAQVTLVDAGSDEDVPS